MAIQDTHLEIIEPETKKQINRKELSQPASISTIDEIANEINARQDLEAKRTSFLFLAYANFAGATLCFVVVKTIKQALFAWEI